MKLSESSNTMRDIYLIDSMETGGAAKFPKSFTVPQFSAK